ncbi:hypothetical protein [Cellulomonas sp. URHB0016]
MTDPSPTIPANRPWWKNRFLWTWHGTFAVIGLFLLLLRGSPVGLVVLGAAAISFTLMLLASRSVNKENDWVRVNYPDALVWTSLRVRSPGAAELGLAVKGKNRPVEVFLVAHPAGVRLFTGRRRELAVTLPWDEIVGARAASGAEGSTPTDLLTLMLADERQVELYSFDVSTRWPERIILSRPAAVPWPPVADVDAS